MGTDHHHSRTGWVLFCGWWETALVHHVSVLGFIPHSLSFYFIFITDFTTILIIQLLTLFISTMKCTFSLWFSSPPTTKKKAICVKPRHRLNRCMPAVTPSAMKNSVWWWYHICIPCFGQKFSICCLPVLLPKNILPSNTVHRIWTYKVSCTWGSNSGFKRQQQQNKDVWRKVSRNSRWAFLTNIQHVFPNSFQGLRSEADEAIVHKKTAP